MLRRCGSNPISWLTLQPNLEYFGNSDRAFVAFSEMGGNAYVLGDPICPPDCVDQILDQFLREKPNAAFVQVHTDTAQALIKRKFFVSSFGVETSLSLPYSIHGREKKDVRLLFNAAERSGLIVRELAPEERNLAADPKLTAGLNRRGQVRFKEGLSFLARSIIPEDDEVRLFGGFINDDLVGVSVFDPMFSDGDVTGYAEVIPRRLPTAPKGTRVYILIKAMEQFALEGVGEVNLGLSPLCPCQSTYHLPTAPVTGWLLEKTYKHGSSFFNFKGLTFHKSRFRGRETEVFFASRSRLAIIDLWRIYRLTTGRWFPSW